MTRQKSLFSCLILALALAVGMGCSKKPAPSTASEGDMAPAEESTEMSSDMESDLQEGSGDAVAGILSNLPTIYFEFDEATLSPQSRTVLQEIAEGLSQSSNVNLTVEGHCDERGSNEYNLALGERRAQTIREYLSRLGVSGSRVNVVSYGEERPADSGSGEAAWAKNRRAEMVANQ